MGVSGIHRGLGARSEGADHEYFPVMREWTESGQGTEGHHRRAGDIPHHQSGEPEDRELCGYGALLCEIRLF